ncbi:MAG: iron-dependent transcriptional regulator IdeR [Thermoleophilia bacterium]
MPTPAIEEYLESIYKLEARGTRVIGARLAEDLGVSAPTVTEMIRRLQRENFITFSPQKEIRMTERGRRAAEVLIRRHRLSERLLTDILGLPWSLAHDEACKFEHVISPEVEARLAEVLDHPATCPHGNPIPGGKEPGEQEGLCRLSEVPAGSTGVLRCVEGEAEELLSYVETLGLLPGARLEVRGFAPLGGPVEVVVDGVSRFVALAAAERLLVALD